MEDRVSLVLVEQGFAGISVNGKVWNLTAPCAICVSPYDRIALLHHRRLFARAFSFNPRFLNSSLSFEALVDNRFTALEDEHDRNMLNMFIRHHEDYAGIIPLSSSAFLRVREWMEIIGTETYAQSDGMWTCRIRRYLLQSLYLMHDAYMDMAKNGFNVPDSADKDYAELALEYIHTHYQEPIKLETVTKTVNLNRTSLNKKFKELTGHTVMDYLLRHRIKIACEALTHTNLRISELAEACGFAYDTYFIKQFTNKMGMSPMEYRHSSWVRRKESAIQSVEKQG
jgi:AraC-like DNA-binding protein